MRPLKYFTRPFLALLVVFGLTKSGVLPLISPARAQQIEVGIIDEDKLADGYTKYKDAVIALDKQVQELDGQLDSRELLNETEGKAFDQLITVAKRSDADNTALQNLVKAGSGRRAEMLDLIGKAARTADDEKRLKALNDQSAVNSGVVRSIQDKLYDQIKQNQGKIDDQFTSRANEVISQVAADKKLTLVWRKRAIIWNAASVDITAAVLERLNKG